MSATGNRCDACRKIVFPARSDAKLARRSMGEKGLSVYPCPMGGGFHLGHLSPAVKAGLVTRGEIYRPVSP